MYNKKWEKTKKIILLAAVVIAIIVVIVVLNNNSKANVNNGANAGNVTGQNYVQSADGSKVNTSQQVSQNKQVGDVVIEKSTIVYTGGVSKLTSKVTNNGTDLDNLRFKVKFIAADGSTIAESVGYVGKITTGETRYIDSDITTDTSNAKDITYEVIE